VAGSRPWPARIFVLKVLLDTKVLSDPLREHPDMFVLEQLQDGTNQLPTASVVIHQLAYGVQRLPTGRKRQRLAADLDGLLKSGMQVLPYDCRVALWHGQQRGELEAQGRRTAFADWQIAAIAATIDLVMVTRKLNNFADCEGLQLLYWFSEP